MVVFMGFLPEWCVVVYVMGCGYSGAYDCAACFADLAQGSSTAAGTKPDTSPQAGDLADQRGRNEAVLLGRGQEQGLDLGDQVAVHAGHLEFVFEVGHRAQAAQQHPPCTERTKCASRVSKPMTSTLP